MTRKRAPTPLTALRVPPMAHPSLCTHSHASRASRFTPTDLGVVSLVALLTVLLISRWDLAIAQWFWSEPDGWRLADQWWIRALYRYGTVPALVIGLCGFGVWLAGRWHHTLRRWRGQGLFLGLALLLGPGLVTNGLLKKVCHRPRPVQVMEFGGTEQYQPLWHTLRGHTGHSLPSGHAAMGFFWIAPALLWWPTRRTLAWVSIALVVLHGGAMSLGRLAQGGHWLSDTLTSLVVIGLSAWGIKAWLTCVRTGPSDPSDPEGSGWLTDALAGGRPGEASPITRRSTLTVASPAPVSHLSPPRSQPANLR
jgi:lipid A 4'-phosphatase